jgi:hypothetical protein
MPRAKRSPALSEGELWEHISETQPEANRRDACKREGRCEL